MTDPFDVERTPPFTALEVLKIAITPDPEIRNYKVTMAYWQMSRFLDSIIHGNIDGSADDLTGETNWRNRTSNANWFTVATWAINTVGRNIRSGELPRRVEQLLPAGVRAQATPWILQMRSRSGRRVQRSLDYGQIVVFISTMLAALKFVDDIERDRVEEIKDVLKKLAGDEVDLDDAGIAPLLAEFWENNPRIRELMDPACPSGGEELPTTPISKIYAALTDRAGIPHHERGVARSLVERGYLRRLRSHTTDEEYADIVEMLRDPAKPFNATLILKALSRSLTGSDKSVADLDAAFAAYGRASKSKDPEEVAQETFRGNLIIGAVEQVLLDYPVTAVIDHIPQEVDDWMIGSTSVWTERTLGIPRSLGRLGAARRFKGTQDLFRESWARFLTDQILVVALPTETIRIGRDIPLRSWDEEFIPIELAELSTQHVKDKDKVKRSAADEYSTDALFRLFDRSRGDGVRTGAWDWRRFDERLNFTANLLVSRQQDRTLFWAPFSAEDQERISNDQAPIRSAAPFEPYVVSPTEAFLEDVR